MAELLVIPPDDDAKTRYREYLDSLPTVTLPPMDLRFDDGANLYPKTIILVATDGTEYVFDQSHPGYWEILDGLEIVEE